MDGTTHGTWLEYGVAAFIAAACLFGVYYGESGPPRGMEALYGLQAR